MGCSSPGSSVQGILQARILEWVAIPASSRYSQVKDHTHVLYISCISRQMGSLPLVLPPPGKPPIMHTYIYVGVCVYFIYIFLAVTVLWRVYNMVSLKNDIKLTYTSLKKDLVRLEGTFLDQRKNICEERQGSLLDLNDESLMGIWEAMGDISGWYTAQSSFQGARCLFW